MATDDDVLFVGVVGISKRREARVGLCLLGFGFLCQTDILLRSTVLSKSLSCEMKSELSEEERQSRVVINRNEEQKISVAFENFLLE